MTALPRSDVERFRTVVARRLGLHFDDGRLPLLADTLERRLEALGRASETYLGQLDTEPEKVEIGILSTELTVTETYFFRNIDQFHATAEVALPARRAARLDTKRLRLLSAGCASGEEPYSLSILLREAAFDPSWSVAIRAVDVNPAALEKAKHGRYSRWALRETPAAVQSRWFSHDARGVVLEDDARSFVHFEEQNLAEENPDLWPCEAYDIVFCRNVLMYFVPETAQFVVEHIAHSLAPGGFLFLGHAETLRGLSQSFHLRHTHGTFYYQRKEAAHLTPSAPPPALPVSPMASSPIAAVVDGAESWVDAIRGASERIEALTRAPRPTPRSAGERLSALPPRWDLDKALELLESERFSDALELVQSLPAEAAMDPDVLLLRAALLTHGGQLALAEDTCLRLLAVDELNAGARYLLALCREGAGDGPGAAEHDQMATYLDPAFAMPRFHLGLLARRSGHRETARRELALALSLLRREDASRLLLFGGGFGRGALVAMCRAELVACGGTP